MHLACSRWFQKLNITGFPLIHVGDHESRQEWILLSNEATHKVLTPQLMLCVLFTLTGDLFVNTRFLFNADLLVVPK